MPVSLSKFFLIAALVLFLIAALVAGGAVTASGFGWLVPAGLVALTAAFLVP